jgi:NADPH2:quinone reductase
MVKAIRFHETGGPEVLRFEEITLGRPGPGEALVRQGAVGLNFIDVYFRKGQNKTPLPSGSGFEAAGVVEAIGEGVTAVAVGDRVAYAMIQGAAAEAALVPAARLVKLPDSIGEETAAAMMLKGMTAEYLLHRTYPLKRGETILFYAAAGGVGVIACQWAHAMGATVIGVVGSEAKLAEAKAAGCAHVLVMGRDDIVALVKDITMGVGVSVVYDSIGRDTVQISLVCLRPRGLLVSFGASSGPVTALDLAELAKSSTSVTRPSLAHYIATRAELEASAAALFDAVTEGQVRIEVRQRYALKDTAQAHRDLESRKTTGASILLP